MNRAVAKKPKRDLGSTLERVRRGERVVLRRGRKAVAAVVPIEDLKRLQKLEDEEDLQDVRAALKEASRKGTIPWEKVKSELGLQ
jgi:prevent-host-death family protein